ncbi:hypothetical protein LIER_06332 [Lithospermum erythrorhizon]|uniref:Ig-like domain-containing protein n=1 Tax=Lithospermum erythrorhizon TaxID=34254 RepID=A0AAV3P556_LITER
MVNCVGRIIVSWNPNNVSVQLVCSSKQNILVRVQDLIHNKRDFFMIVVYVKHTLADRRVMWSSLVDDVCRVNGESWLIWGDFNIVRNASESVGGGVPDNLGMKEFNECISSISVMEMPHTGCSFTWSRNWSINGMEYAHCHVDVSIVSNIPSDPKPLTSLQICEECFKNLNKQAFSNISVRVVEMKYKFEEIQELVLQGDVSREILCKAKDITMNLLCKAESEFYRNKARMGWYKDGNDNTKLFHSSMRINQSKNAFSAQATTINKQDLITCAIKKRIDVVDFEDLQKSVTEEIESTFLGMRYGTAPHPDGLSLEFYKDSWSIVKNSVNAAV